MNLKSRKIPISLLLLTLLLLCGFAPGTQSSTDEVRRTAEFVPQLEEILSHPTVGTRADYDVATDAWRVTLTENASGTSVAELSVADDTRRVREVEVFPAADTVEYPNLSED